jgi:hypothetical protein
MVALHMKLSLAAFILGVSVTSSPAAYAVTEIAHIPLPTGTATNEGIQGIAISGNHAFAADTSGNLLVFNVSDPAKTAKVSSTRTGSPAHGVAVSHAYLGNSSDGVRVFDISDPSNPRSIGSIPLDSRIPAIPTGVTVFSNMLCIAAYDAGIRLYDVSVPARPLEIYRSPKGFVGQAFRALIDRDHLYVASGYAGLRVYKIANK